MFGPMLLQGLKSYGIDVSGVAEDPSNSSGIAMILLDANRQNHIVAIYGANAACGEAQLQAVRQALEGADALLLQLETPLDVSLAAARDANDRGVRVIWDPAPAGDVPPDLFAAADILTPNQGEAEALTGVHVTNAESAREAAEALLEKGATVVVVKLGELGAYYMSHEVAGHVPPLTVEVVDTIAAGDAFGGALAVALAEGHDLEAAVRYGAAAGALAVTLPGAQEAMPGRRRGRGAAGEPRSLVLTCVVD